MLKNCWRSPTNFRLHSALTRVDVLLDDKGFRVYEGKKVPGVEIDKLAYFGASIFWRASVHTWPLGNTPDPRLSLGPYRNALRLYLLGKTGIPDCIAPGFLDSGVTVFASTRPRPARRGRVVPERGFGSCTSLASTARCTSA